MHGLYKGEDETHLLGDSAFRRQPSPFLLRTAEQPCRGSSRWKASIRGLPVASIWSPATQMEKAERLIKLFVITRGVGFVAGSCREPSLPMTLAESGKAEGFSLRGSSLASWRTPQGESVE